MVVRWLLVLVAAFTGGATALGGDVNRIAILGCLKQNEPAPALEKCLEAKPDLCLWIGDNVYADTKTSPDVIRDCYATLAAKPGFQGLRSAAPWVATWDDHDFGLNDAGGDYRFKHESRDLFRAFWQLADEIPADRDGVYYAKTFPTHGKTLQLILLDPRFNRDEPGPRGDTLGERQWGWLKTALQEPADLRLVVSGYQVLLDAGTGSETWAEFPAARRRLFDLIRSSNAEHVVFLTGDQHYGEVCRLRDALGYDAVELQFSGVNQIEPPEFNSTRVSPVSRSRHSFALLDIRWRRTAQDMPHLLFHVVDADTGRDDLVYRLNFAELERPSAPAAGARPQPSGRCPLTPATPTTTTGTTDRSSTPSSEGSAAWRRTCFSATATCSLVTPWGNSGRAAHWPRSISIRSANASRRPAASRMMGGPSRCSLTSRPMGQGPTAFSPGN